jgi:branched-chain amino acid aminotransferase
MNAASEPGTPGHVWVDGRILPAAGPHISAFDRGFQLGDGVFETLRARGGRAIELDEHLERLGASAAALAIALTPDRTGRLGSAIADLLRAEHLAGADDDASIRITVSRGTITARGLLPLDETAPATIVVQAWPVAEPPPGHLEDGLHLVTSSVRRDPASPLAAFKTTSRVDYVFARLEARRAGADDALFLTVDGRLSEATSANVFLVRRAADGVLELATPALDCAILPGTTRSWLLAWAGRVGLRAVEAGLAATDLAAADEAFLSASVSGVLPITRFDDAPIGDGHPGSWTRRARADREAFIRSGDGGRTVGAGPGRPVAATPARPVVP